MTGCGHLHRARHRDALGSTPPTVRTRRCASSATVARSRAVSPTSPSTSSSSSRRPPRYATASVTPAGHSIVTSGGTLPVGAPLPCFECHNPHGSKRDNTALITDERGASLTTTSAAGVREFCFTCHSTSDTVSGWDSASATYTAVSSADKVVGLPRDGGVLLLPAHDGHAQADTASCYDCHGASYAAGGRTCTTPASRSPSCWRPRWSRFPIRARSVGCRGRQRVRRRLGFARCQRERHGDRKCPCHRRRAGPAGSAKRCRHHNGNSVRRVAACHDVRRGGDLHSRGDHHAHAFDEFGGSGVAQTYWVLDAGPIETGTVVATSAVGPHTLTYWSVDNAGNVESSNTVQFTVEAFQALGLGPALAARRSWGIPNAVT